MIAQNGIHKKLSKIGKKMELKKHLQGSIPHEAFSAIFAKKDIVKKLTL